MSPILSLVHQEEFGYAQESKFVVTKKVEESKATNIANERPQIFSWYIFFFGNNEIRDYFYIMS